MSLLLHLPFIGDLQNRGIGDYSITSVGSYSWVNGKIGQALNLNNSTTSTNAIKVNSNMCNDLGTEYTAAVWIYPLGNHPNYNGCIISSGNWNTANKRWSFGVSQDNTKVDAFGFDYNTYVDCSIPLNTWTHIASVQKNNTAYVYKNGALVATRTMTRSALDSDKTFTHIGMCSYGNYFGFNGYINDLKIYNNALSPLEIKQLSQGLILHYPLDNNGLGNENLAIKTGERAPDNSSQVEWRGFKLGNLPITTNEILTVSFDLKMVIGTAVNGYPYLLVYNTNYKGPHAGWIYVSNNSTNKMIPSGNYAVGDIIKRRVSVTITTPSSFTAGSQTEDWIEFYSNYSTENEITITNIKVERGSKATPWIPAKADDVGNILGFNDDIEYDTSGYNHNGITTNGLEFSTDTPRYITSTKFGTNQCIKASPLSSEVKTLSCWAKTTANKSTSQFMVADSASNMCITFYNGNIIGVFGTTRSTGSKSALGTSYKENEWNHFVVVKTGDAGERDIYCNGVKLTPISNDYWGSATGFWVGTRNDSNALPFQGYISDVRAYVTAFTEEEVQLLYQNSAYISSNGTNYAYDYVEE